MSPGQDRSGPSAVVGEVQRTRCVAVVRAERVPDAATLVGALRDGGMPVVELTFTVPDLPRHLAAAASVPGAVVGAGTVLTESQAVVALDAGARFLVTPAVLPETPAVVRRAHAAGVPAVVGALTPSEVGTAHALGADVVKLFPARVVGPGYLRDLAGPFPGLRLMPSGGVDAASARDWLDAGAVAVSAGGDVVPPAVVAAGDWEELRRRAEAFRAALR